MSDELEPIETLVKRDLSGWAESLWNCTTGNNYLRGGEYVDLIRTLDSYARKLAAVTAERDALLADARRYRWLSRSAAWPQVRHELWMPISAAEFDATIDAAIAKEQKP